jgi:hypothetical protein
MGKWEALTKADAHVARGEMLVTKQRERIERLRAMGVSTEDAERSLTLFLGVLAALGHHRKHIITKTEREYGVPDGGPG